MATTLTDAVDSDSNTFIVSDDALLGSRNLPVALQIDNEKFLVRGYEESGVWHVDRGVDGSQRTAHDAGAAISYVWSAVGSGGLFLPDLPTSDPGVAGQVWSDSGTLKVSAG
jgi:hypothetical protein